MIYVDILESTIVVEILRNIPRDENIITRRDGLELLNMAETLCKCDVGNHVIYCLLHKNYF